MDVQNFRVSAACEKPTSQIILYTNDDDDDDGYMRKCERKANRHGNKKKKPTHTHTHVQGRSNIFP